MRTFCSSIFCPRQAKTSRNWNSREPLRNPRKPKSHYQHRIRVEQVDSALGTCVLTFSDACDTHPNEEGRAEKFAADELKRNVHKDHTTGQAVPQNRRRLQPARSRYRDGRDARSRVGYDPSRFGCSRGGICLGTPAPRPAQRPGCAPPRYAVSTSRQSLNRFSSPLSCFRTRLNCDLMPSHPGEAPVTSDPRGREGDKWSQRWAQKWALSTGASAGIGWALAEQLAGAGAHLVLTARRTDRLQKLATDLAAKHGVKIEVFGADLVRQEAPGEIHAFTTGKNIAIELLVNNAGFGAFGYMHEVSEPRLLEMIQVNCSAVVHLTRLYVPEMVRRRCGDVLIVASTAAFQAVPFNSVYAATKAFDLIFAEGIAEELRPFGVRVCALCPGPPTPEFSTPTHHH